MNYTIIFFAFFSLCALASGAKPKPTNLKRTNAVLTMRNETENATDAKFEDKMDDFVDNVDVKDYCYDSTYAFKCRQTSPDEYELECKIDHFEGVPCFPDVEKMINDWAPLTTIRYPIHTTDALDAADDLKTVCMITPDNIEKLTIIAPITRMPADSFAKLPSLKRIVMETMDDVDTMRVHKDVCRGTNATHIHFIGYHMPSIVELRACPAFTTVAFTGTRVECTKDEKLNEKNKTCERMFDTAHTRNWETLIMDRLHIKDCDMDETMFRPLWDTLKKLALDVTFERKTKIEEDEEEEHRDINDTEIKPDWKRAGWFPMETFAFMNRLEDLSLHLYEPILGLSVRNETTVPLPVAKTLRNLDLACRYCKSVDLQDLGEWMPKLHRLHIAAPLKQKSIDERCLKTLTHLKELILEDVELRCIKEGAFKKMTELKSLAIKYAPIVEMRNEHWHGVEKTLETLTITGTTMRRCNMSDMERLTDVDLRGNRLETFERCMLHKKAEFDNFDISYNPIKRLERGFLDGVVMKKRVMRLHGTHMEEIDFNIVDGMDKLRTLDLTRNEKLERLRVTDHKTLPEDLREIIVGRSPLLKLHDEKKCMSDMIRERNITLVVEGAIACTCDMRWMLDLHAERPDFVEFTRSRAVCSRTGTKIDDMPEEFWKKPTVKNFMKMLKDDKICKKHEKMRM